MRKKKPPNIKHTRTPTLPPLPFYIFFLWCIHFSKVISEAFPSWLLKQKKCLPQEAHEAIAVAWTVSLCTDATGEEAGRGGGGGS